MKNRTIALAVASLMFGAGSAYAEGVSVDGFVDVQLNVTNEADEDSEGQFTVPQTEVNFDSENMFIAIRSSGDNDYGFGQAFFKYQVADGWNMKGGVFDNNITADSRSAPDMQFTQNSLLFSVLSDVGGESLTGLAIAGAVGPATVTAAYANDSSITSGEGKNSIALLVNAAPMEGLDLELGLLTQEDDPATSDGVGNLIDINGTYKIQNATLGLDYLMGGDPEDGEFDAGYSFWAGYDFGNGFNVKARLENIGFEGGGDDTEATELYASYALTDNLSVALDLYSVDDGTESVDTNTIEFVATF